MTEKICEDCLKEKKPVFCFWHECKRNFEHSVGVMVKHPIATVLIGLALLGFMVYNAFMTPPPPELPTFTIDELPGIVMRLELPWMAWVGIFLFLWLTKW